MPSFLTKKRSRLVTTAVASTLVVAAAASTAAATLASHPGAALAGNADASMTLVTRQPAAKAEPGGTMSPAQGLAGFDRVRFGLGEIQNRNDAAAAKAAAAKAAAAKAAAKAAAAKAAAKTVAQQTAARTPSGSPIVIAQQMIRQFGWSPSQFTCLYPLWEHESGWNPSAENPGSGAYGIPQSLPGSQMASAGRDWQTNPATQIRWGLTYIQGRYGSPCGAWAHEQSSNWY
jgi:Transglycosylase SLT domain